MAIAASVLLPVTQASAFERLEQFGVGSAAAGAGGITAPTDVDVTADGMVIVSDIGADRVSAFAASGKFLWAVGKDVSVFGGTGGEICTDDCQNGVDGEGAGELNAPWGIAAGPDEFYVSDLSNARVNAFDYEGKFLRAFGKDVGGSGLDVCTAICVHGAEGPGDGQMAGPAGIALDSSGDLFVSELGTNRVDVFDPRTGKFLRAFGKDVGGPGVNTCTSGCEAGTEDESPGSLNTAYALTIGPNDEVVVGDIQNSMVSIFTNQGQLIRTFGSPGDGAGQFRSPYGVAVTPDGETLYVADGFNNRVATYAIDGEFQRAMGLNVIPGAPVVAEVCTTVCQEGSWGGAIGEFATPEAIATDQGGNLYVNSWGRIDKWGEPLAAPSDPEGSTLETASIAAIAIPEETSSPPEELAPSNSLRFGERKLNIKKGTAKIEVIVAGSGKVVARAGHKVRATATQPKTAGPVTIALKATGRGRHVLKRSGRLWAALRVTFTPRGGTPYTRTKAVRLLLKG